MLEQSSELWELLRELRSVLLPHRSSPDESLFVFRNANQSVVKLLLKLWRIRLLPRGERVSPDDCPNCGGTGYVAKPVDLNGRSDGVAFIRSKCPVCGGTGRKRPSPPKAAG